MRIEPLSIADSWVITPRVHGDERGCFLEWFRSDVIAEATGRRIAIAQANHSISARGVVRGVHFVDVPPGQAKYVYCASGAVLDVVVDVRVDSPTYGEHACVQLDDSDRRAVLISEGLGHAFCALREPAQVVYLTSTTYEPTRERTVSPLDPALALPWHEYVESTQLSERDRAAGTLEAARVAGILPALATCKAHYQAEGPRS